MAGFADALGFKQVTNWLDPRRNALIGLGAGIASGQDLGQGVALGLQYGQQGRQIDDANAIRAKEEAERQRQIEEAAALKSKYAEFFTQQGRPDIARGIADGIVEPGAAYMDFIKPKDAAKPMEINGQLVDPVTGKVLGDYRTDPTAKGGPAEVALQPTWLQDAQGNWVLGQLAKDGSVVQTKLPEGMRPASPGQLAGDKTGASVDAKTAAAARAALPGAEQMATITAKTIAEVRNNAAGMKEWFSQIGPRGAYIHPGSEMGKFYAAASPTNAQAFMQARDMLKGGGPITDYEGRRAEDAMSRMQAALDTGDQQAYLNAIADFEDAVATGYAKLVQTAQGGYSADAVGSAPDLKSKYGLE